MPRASSIPARWRPVEGESPVRARVLAVVAGAPVGAGVPSSRAALSMAAVSRSGGHRIDASSPRHRATSSRRPTTPETSTSLAQTKKPEREQVSPGGGVAFVVTGVVRY